MIAESEDVKQIAHIVDNIVVNVSLWDGESEWESSDLIVEIPKDIPVGIGWGYINNSFVDNRPTEENQ